METRITGGTLRGRRLRGAKTGDLRPTSERVRGAIFSILGPGAIEGARVLDLYAGTGALGIEALSRGGASVVFVESSAESVRGINRSLSELGIGERSQVRRGKVERVLNTLEGSYDVAFLDPPYSEQPWDAVLNTLAQRSLADEGGFAVAEHRHGSVLADSYGRLQLQTRKRYGDTVVSVYEAGAKVG